MIQLVKTNIKVFHILQDNKYVGNLLSNEYINKNEKLIFNKIMFAKDMTKEQELSIEQNMQDNKQENKTLIINEIIDVLKFSKPVYKQLEYFSIKELKSILQYANKIDKEGLLSVLNLESIDDYNLHYEIMNGLRQPIDHKIEWKAINMLSKGKKLIEVYKMSNDMKEKDIECLI